MRIRIRDRNAAETFAVLRHFALGLTKCDKTTKVGIKIRRLKARWGKGYLAHLLFGWVA